MTRDASGRLPTESRRDWCTTMLARRFLSSASSSLAPTIRQLLASPPPLPAAASVTVNGWVKSIRRQKKVAFAVISDGSSDAGLQAVFTNVNLAERCVEYPVFFWGVCTDMCSVLPMVRVCGCKEHWSIVPAQVRKRSSRSPM